ncbi:peptide deformylase [candidate division KSB1 bacterium]|nr:peptide deformylase [candidate division KSB1 bacterium]
MASHRIVRFGNPILRIKAQPIQEISDELKKLADDMVETMIHGEGIGLAAPQISRSIAMFVIHMGLIEENGEPMAVINPEIIETKGEISYEEGCLCIPDIREEVKRPEIIHVKYMDIEGREHEEEFGGYKARVFQHEIDHLNGVLFVDRLGSMKRKLLQKQLKQIADEEMTILAQEEEE